ncbi:MAG TPA: YciI family protein [Polyangia bacterium]
MKYMLMMSGTKADMQQFGTLSPDEIRAHIRFMKQLNEELKASGELVDAQGLSGPDQAKIVRARPGGGAAAVTDGPFPESKEFLAGYWIVDCRSYERAVEIAARASAAPGRAGVPLNIPIELREVGVAPDV